MSNKITPFQQELMDAAGFWLDRALECNQTKYANREEYNKQCAYREAKAKFLALLARAVDRDNPLVGQVIDSIYLRALELACEDMATLENFRKIECGRPKDYIELAEKRDE